MLLRSRTPLDAQIASFSEDEDPFAGDATILDRNDLLKDMDAVENRYAMGIATAIFSSVDRVLPQVMNTLGESNSRQDKLKALEKIEWSGATAVQSALTGLWHEGWGLGSTHATQELNVNLSKNGRNSNYAHHSNIAEFRSRGVFVAYPPDYGVPLQNSALKEAVNQRTLKLANDVAADTARSIQRAVYDAVDKHSGSKAVPQVERTRLVQRINLALGRQSAKEIRDPNKGIGDPLVATQRVGTALTSRARTIALTELSASYSLGRLQTYLKAGVKRVRWQAIGDMRTCAICRTRSGTVHDLRTVLSQTRTAYRAAYDPSEFVIPAHPNDRCHWEPLFDEDDHVDAGRFADPRRNPVTRSVTPLRKGWAALGLANSVAAAVGRRQREAQQERVRQSQVKKLFFKTIVTGGATALSLSLLYALLAKDRERQEARQQEEVKEGKAEEVKAESLVERLTEVETDEIVTEAFETRNKLRAAQEAVRTTEVRPDEAMDADLARRFPELLASDLDLSVAPQSTLERYGLRREDISKLTRQVQLVKRNLGEPLSKQLSPNLLPSEMLARYPDLRDIDDLRQLTTDDLIRAGVDRGKAPQIESFIRRHLQNKVGLPAVQVGRGTAVGSTDLATASPEQIASTLPANLNNRDAVAADIARYIKQRALSNDPVTDVGDLANVPGVGKKTIRNWRSQQFVDNPNSALSSFTPDPIAAESLASQLGIGSKKATEIVREFREGGEYLDEDDVIARLDRRLSGTSLQLSEREKRAIRRSLKGKTFPVGAGSSNRQALRGVQKQSVGGAAEQELTQITGVAPSPRVAGAPPAAQIAPGETEDLPGLPPARSPLTTPPGQLPNYQPPTTGRDNRGQRVRDRVRRNQARQPSAPSPGTISPPNQEVIRRRNREAYEDRVDALRESTTNYRNNLSTRVDSAVNRSRLFAKDETVREARAKTTQRSESALKSANDLSLRLDGYTARAKESADRILDRVDAIDERIDTDIDAAEKELNRLRNESRKLLQETVPQPNTNQLLELRGELDGIRSRALAASDTAFDDLQAERSAILDRANNLRRENPDVPESFQPRLNELKDEVTSLSRNVTDARRNQALEEIDTQINRLDYTISKLQGAGQARALQQYQEARARLTNARKRLEQSKDKASARRKALLGVRGLDCRTNEIAAGLSRTQERIQQTNSDINLLWKEGQSDRVPSGKSLGVVRGKLTRLNSDLASYANQLDEAANAARGFLQSANEQDSASLRDILGRLGRARAEVARQRAELPPVRTRYNRVRAVVAAYDQFRKTFDSSRLSARRFEQAASSFLGSLRDRVAQVRNQPRSLSARLFKTPEELRQVLGEYEQAQNLERYFDDLNDFTSRDAAPVAGEERVAILERNWGKLSRDPGQLKPYDATGLGQKALAEVRTARQLYSAYVQARDALATSDSALAREQASTGADRGLADAETQILSAYNAFVEAVQRLTLETRPLARRSRQAYADAMRQLQAGDNAEAFLDAKRQIEAKEDELARSQDNLRNSKKRERPSMEQRVQELERDIAELDKTARDRVMEVWDAGQSDNPRRQFVPARKEIVRILEQEVEQAERDAKYFPKDRAHQAQVRERLNRARRDLAEARRNLRATRGLTAADEDTIFAALPHLAQFNMSDNYTKPRLREKLKRQIENSSKGGRPGQWSARKAQLLAQQYKAKGGGYKSGSKGSSQKSLKKWTKQKWRTSDGKPAIRGDKTARYLPDSAWEKLSKSERDATNRKKREGKGQFVPNTKKAKGARKAAFSLAPKRGILRAIRHPKDFSE